MAAVPEAPSSAVVALRHMLPADLEPILAEEECAWRAELDWDFRPSADLVRRFVGMRALHGHGLWIAGRAVGYCYFVTEEHKGLVGDLYILREYACSEYEDRLLGAALTSMMESPFLRRIESQLMMLADPLRADFPHPEFLRSHLRNFMRIDLAYARDLRPGPAAARVHLQNWSEDLHDDAAQLIAAAYEGHIDGDINDQYRSAAGARRFLTNIVQYPGCGTFFPAASFLAFDKKTSRLDGLCLASLVADDVGHITQVCVSPAARGTGVGYELIRRSLLALAAHNCRRSSLTVTASNRGAVALYERMGFSIRKQFTAHVWESF
jgi:ribosomal protein S18 acetylase RimI-like enzyme